MYHIIGLNYVMRVDTGSFWKSYTAEIATKMVAINW